MKLFSKLTLCGAFLLGAVVATEAQDVRFSQYYAAPLRLNPAMIGMFEGNIRVGLNYRSQWGAVLNKAYKSFAATGDMKFAVGQNDYAAAGISAMTDFSGTGNYNTTEVYFGGSFHKKLTKSRRGFRFREFESYLIAGAQVGFGQRSIKPENLTFSQQWDPDQGIYDQGTYSGEALETIHSRMYFDGNAGLMWAASMGKRNNMYLGMGVYHLNRPNISLFRLPVGGPAPDSTLITTERLYMRWVAHAGGEVQIGGSKSPISLVPGVVTMFQGPSLEINGGLSMRYQAPSYDDFAFRIGVWTRFANRLDAFQSVTAKVAPESVMFLVGLDYRTFQLGLSYDLAVSTLRSPLNGRGAMEVSLFYRFDRDLKRAQGCPTF